MISPRSTTRKIITTVEGSTARGPNIRVDQSTDRETAERLTMVSPTSTVCSILPGFFIMESSFCACRFPSSESACSCSLFMVTMAVSAEEKNAEAKSRTAKIINCKTSPESKKFNSFSLEIGHMAAYICKNIQEKPVDCKENSVRFS